MNTIEQAEQRAAAMRASWQGESIVTAKGLAVVAVYQIKRALIDMAPADRAEIVTELRALISEQDAAAWADFGAALATTREG